MGVKIDLDLRIYWSYVNVIVMKPLKEVSKLSLLSTTDPNSLSRSQPSGGFAWNHFKTIPGEFFDKS